MRTRERRWVAFVSGAAFAVSATIAGAPGAEEKKAPVRIMQEPGDVVDVLDAFDVEYDDAFDISVSLGFQYLSKRARILRETTIFEPGLTTGGFTSRTMNVGQYIETTAKLSPRLEIGIWHDLAAYVRLPIVLENERRIDDRDGSAGKLGAVAGGAPGERLFTLPFQGPTRSGPEHVAVGVNFGILNQARDPTKPSWMFGAEGRISAGPAMHACDQNTEPSCTHPGDVNRNGQHDSGTVDANGSPIEAADAGKERTPGVTRGTFGLEVHSVMSKRIKYVEPYGGFSALVEFQQGEDSDFGETDVQGALVNHPPIVGQVMLGMMVHPWENREKFGRLTFDVRFTGEYHSEGRDYSEMFDVLGASAAPSLRTPKWARFRDACPGADCDPKSVVDESSQKTYFTGLTVVEPYGSYGASGSVTWRAAEYVKLNVGLGLHFDQAHGITHDQPCNPDFKDDFGASGPCHADLGTAYAATGIPNPVYRPTINAVGRRFYVDESITYEVFASGVVMF